jgi:Glycosyl transferase family 2
LPSDASQHRVSGSSTSPTAVPELAAKLAQGHGLAGLASIGWPEWSAGDIFPALSHVSLGSSWSSVDARAQSGDVSREAAIVDVRGAGESETFAKLPRFVGDRPLVVIQADEAHANMLVKVLVRAGMPPTFLGEAQSTTEGRSAVLVIDQLMAPRTARAPSDFRVLAVITAFNEIDLLEATIKYLRRDSVGVHVIDNWSTDGTFELAEQLASAGEITLERFPADPPSTFNHGQLLRRVEDVANHASADWTIHHDMDERRRPPWADLTLRDAFYAVERSGFNAVNHTVVTFRPTDDTWTPGIDPETHLRHFELEARPDLLLQIRAWRSTPGVDLATTGGHEARFDGRRVFPYQFLLKHYPLRSQEQAERKVFRERRLRWNKQERARGWHRHYDQLRQGDQFIWQAKDLSEFVEGRTQREFFIPFVGGAEVGQKWAARARIAAAEVEFMTAQTLRIRHRLERVLGPTWAERIVGLVRRFAWVLRPVRRTMARRSWGASGAGPKSVTRRSGR